MTEKFNKKRIKQQEIYQDILSGMEDWVRVVDLSNRVIYMNDPMKKAVGNNIGFECYLSLGRNSPCSNCISSRTLIEDRPLVKEEVVNQRIYSVISSPIKNKNNRIYCSVEVFRDITEARSLETLTFEQNRKMKHDLNIAKQLQHKILPENKVYNTLKIESIYLPSEILGGDVFDVIEVDDDNIGMYIADVSGHGVTSSMMTMFIRQTLKSIGNDAIHPEVTLKQLYHRYRELNIDDQYYITIFYGVYNKTNNLFSYSNAGHNCLPILIGLDGQVLELELSGYPIFTLFDDVEYDKQSISLSKGDKIVFYTDGIGEAFSLEEGFFASDRVLQICKEHKKKDIQQLIKIIMQDVTNFTRGNVKDDMAIMAGEIL